MGGSVLKSAEDADLVSFKCTALRWYNTVYYRIRNAEVESRAHLLDAAIRRRIDLDHIDRPSVSGWMLYRPLLVSIPLATRTSSRCGPLP
jgi:hypothetical protein